MQPYWPVVVTAALTLAVTGAAYRTVANSAEHAAANAFSAACRVSTSNLERRLLAYGAVVKAGVAFYAASNEVTREEWRQFVLTSGPGERFPGLYGVAFVERVHSADLDEFVRQARASGAPEFKIQRPRNADVEDTGGVHYIIKYHEPIEVNRQALGLDLATRNANRRAYDAAMRSGGKQLSCAVQLVQQSQGLGVVMTHPVYRRGMPPRRKCSERRR